MIDWQFVEGQKRHTQDGCVVAALMKSVGKGKRPVLAIDVGCGDGIIAYDMFKHRKATKVWAFDVLPACAKAATFNLQPQIALGICEVTAISASGVFRNRKNWDRFDRFVINPPFFVCGSGEPNKRSLDQTARHEGSLSLKNWSKGASKILKTGGELYCVFPTERLSELLSVLASRHLEPKEIWWLKQDRRKRRVFVRAVRGARPGVIVHFDFIL
jgi:tRNA1Val (adenine37-N6)-methyltransferase